MPVRQLFSAETRCGTPSRDLYVCTAGGLATRSVASRPPDTAVVETIDWLETKGFDVTPVIDGETVSGYVEFEDRRDAAADDRIADYTKPVTFEDVISEELRSELAAITEEIEEWQTIYDVETWEELEQSLADGSLSSDELHERRDVITRWEENLEDRRLIKHALAIYSEVKAAREQRINVTDRVAN